jgi:ribosome assembly protein YihI (activator of Der GTPase)
MMVVVVSLHECLVYYRNSVDRDAEKEKKNKQTKNTRLLSISRAVGGWSTRQHGEENIKGSRVKTKKKTPKNVRQT